MTLPKIFNPTYDIKIPSLKKSYKFQPYLVKEEKMLLMAKESDDESDMLMAIFQLVKNCSMDSSFDINKIALFDLEYLFIKLRMHSVDNICSITYTIDKNTVNEKSYDFKVNLQEVEVKFPEKIDNNIPITNNVGLLMKYPPATLYNDKEFLKLKNEEMFNLILRCIDQIYEGENTYDAKDYSIKDLSDFIGNLSPKVYTKIIEFLENLPSLNHPLEYTDKEGQKKTMWLKTLSDFFTFR